jgi:hypothetical protein
MSETRKIQSAAYQACKAMLDKSDPVRYRRQLDSINRFAMAIEGDSLDIREDRIFLDDPKSSINRPEKIKQSWKPFIISCLLRWIGAEEGT